MEIRAKGARKCRSTCPNVYLRTVRVSDAHEAIESCSLGIDPTMFGQTRKTQSTLLGSIRHGGVMTQRSFAKRHSPDPTELGPLEIPLKLGQRERRMGRSALAARFQKGTNQLTVQNLPKGL